MPSTGRGGVDSALPKFSLPVRSSKTAISVKVPPISAARRRRDPFLFAAVRRVMVCSGRAGSIPCRLHFIGLPAGYRATAGPVGERPREGIARGYWAEALPRAILPRPALKSATVTCWIETRFSNRKNLPDGWNERIVLALGASGGGPTWTTEGYKHMTGSTGRRVICRRSSDLPRQQVLAPGLMHQHGQRARRRHLRRALFATSHRRVFGLSLRKYPPPPRVAAPASRGGWHPGRGKKSNPKQGPAGGPTAKGPLPARLPGERP